MKAKVITDFNARAAKIVEFALKSNNWQGHVLGMQSDDTLDPGATPSEGDRYVIQDAADLHANFGSIDEKFTGYDGEGGKTFSVVVLGDDDVVEYMADAYSGTGGFVVTFDVSVEAKDAVTINDADSHMYQFGASIPAWQDSGEAYEPSFTETDHNYSPASEVAVNTEHAITLPNATKAGFAIIVSIEGDSLKKTNTTNSGAHGYSHTAGTDQVKVRVPYTIETNEVVHIVYKY